ncbi:ParM/StbA family protein [Anaerotignum sp.]|uniref:ParM/StbA family protein n=1 Tax=Anaerotignum sp. TaxID=2039241 RepID=UPI0028B1277F|nr:ParM/StbA family protein [Anaerotignum sp.]
MLISIDHGNKQIKTVNRTFTSAFTESDTRPPFGEDILEYKGKYYSLSGSRIPYMRNKVIDDRFFILTLFAIAYEIDAACAYDPDKIMDIQLAIGLPPAHFGLQAEQFEDYFKNRDVVGFIFRGKPYSIYVNEVLCFPQAYAASVPLFGRLKNVPKAVVVDIGGFTADYLLLRNGKGDLSACDSLENGVIVLYNHIQSKVNSDLDLLIEESDVDAILLETSHDFDDNIVGIVEEQAQKFISDLVGKLRERMIDLRSGKAVFVGGGSILLRRQIEACDKVGQALFVDEISANTKGYDLLYRASKVRR